MIAFLSDFGLKDPYVGIVKGVITKRSPFSHVIDITHDITPGHVFQASFILGFSYIHFPKGTIFLAVVDPGVGSKRKGIVVQANGYILVGPDNGIFTHVLEDVGSSWRAHEIVAKKCAWEDVSATFHARDIFGPVAALLDSGLPIEEIGPTTADISTIDPRVAEVKGDEIIGEIVYFDHFGNAITNIPSHLLCRNAHIEVRGIPLEMAICYEAGRGLKGFAILGSHGYLEISSYLNDVRDTLGLKEGDSVIISKASS